MTTTTAMMMTMMMMIGAGTDELVERPSEKSRRDIDLGSSPQCGKEFLFSSRVNFLYRLSHYGVRALSSCAIAFINICAP